MGWNSWDCYAASVTEEQLLQNAEYMRKNLLSHGWEYIVCDIQWSEPLAGTESGEYRPFAPLCMDEYSRLLPAENRFPSSAGGRGFAPLAERIHALGLKFGIHIMRGIPRQAVHARAAVKGAGGTAEKIADPFSICRWNSDMYGVDAAKEGARDYYDSLFDLYATWGVDYVKVDDIAHTDMYPHAPCSAKAEIELIRRAIDRTGRSMVLSLSPGPAAIEEAWHLAEHANMWRVTGDFWDRWDLLKDMFRRCELWQSHVGPGCWPDCDMLPLGHIGMGFHRPRYTNFTKDEQRTLMTLWCIFRSPLMMGGALPDNDEQTLALLTNDEVLAVQRDGTRPRQIRRSAEEAVWINTAPDGALNLALFNLGDEERVVRCPFPAPGLGNVRLRDLWAREDQGSLSGEVSAVLAPHGSALFRLASGERQD
jgi:hypothetical protein